VAGRIRDIGQNLLQSSFQTGCSRSPTYFQIFFPIAVFENALLINIMTLRIHYTIIIIIINNNNVIIIMEGSKTLFRSSKFPWAPKRIPSISTNNLSTTRPQKGSPGLGYSNPRQARFTAVSSFFQVSHYVVFPQFSPCKQVERSGEDGGVRIKNATLRVYSFPFIITKCLWGALLCGPTVKVNTSEF